MNAPTVQISPKARLMLETALETALADVVAKLNEATAESAPVIEADGTDEVAIAEVDSPPEIPEAAAATYSEAVDELAESNVVTVDFERTAEAVDESDLDSVESDEEPEGEPEDYWAPYDNPHDLSHDTLAKVFGEDNVDYQHRHGWFVRSSHAKPEVVKETRPASLTADARELSEAIDKVARIVEKRNTIPILSNVLLSAKDGRLAIEGTDLDIAVRVTVPCQGDDFETTVPSHILQSIVKRKKAGNVSLAIEETTIASESGVTRFDDGFDLRAGTSKFHLPSLPSSDYPCLNVGEFAHEFTLNADDLCEAFRAVEFAISLEETRYYLNGVYLHTFAESGSLAYRVVATDGHRLARFDIKSVDPASILGGVIIPRKTVATLLAHLGKAPKVKKGETAPVVRVKVEISDTKIRFTAGDIVISSKLIDGTFPDYTRVIPQMNDKVLTVDGPALVEAIESVTVITSERGRAVKFSLDCDRLTLSVNNPDCGDASEEVECGYQADGMDIGFNARYLLDILGKIVPPKTKTFPVVFRLDSPGSPTLIQSSHGPDCVLMPMRV